jgi:small multidrug resistance pump
MSPTTIGYIWCALAALASALATLLIKFSGQHGPDWNLLRVTYLGGAGATYALGFVCYTVALQRLEISLAYPVMTGIAMAFVAAFGVLALAESMTVSKVVGMVLVAAGAYALVR